jgi:uncharacterized protein (TIGR02996 family)
MASRAKSSPARGSRRSAPAGRDTNRDAKAAGSPQVADPEAELLAEITSAPDDDAPRLVYADWLLERGNPRGEFIQVQCSLKGGIRNRGFSTDVDRGAPGLVRREAELFHKHHKQWLQPVREYVRGYVWRRGFIARVVSGPAFLPGAATVFAAHPVESLKLAGMTPAAFEALRETPLSRVRQLDLSCQRMGSRFVHVLLGENLARLEDLDIAGNDQLGSAAVVRLATEGHLGSLRRLNLINVQAGDEGLAAISTSPNLQRLESLAIAGNGITALGLRVFTEALSLPRLRQVDLGANHGFDPREAYGADVVAALEARLAANA